MLKKKKVSGQNGVSKCKTQKQTRCSAFRAESSAGLSSGAALTGARQRHVSSLDRHRLLRGRPRHSALRSAQLKFLRAKNLVLLTSNSDVATK